MLNNDENYIVFTQFMERYQKELSQKPADALWKKQAMEQVKTAGIMDGTRPDSSVTRAELATVLTRLDEIKKKLGNNG